MRRALYGTVAALVGSGVWWLGAHYAGAMLLGHDDLYRIGQEALAMKVHGALAFMTVFWLGVMAVHHIPHGWRQKRNRLSGSAVIALFAVLVATGYALYYLVSDDTHAPVSLVHWVVGLVLGPLLILHIVVGRRRASRVDGGTESRRQPAAHRRFEGE